MKVKILQGIPASGKTTWARDYVKKNKDWIRVNRDDLRNMRGEYWIPKQEDLITAMEQSCISDIITHGFNLILDATNLNSRYLESTVNYLQNLGIKPEDIEYKFFNVSLEEAIKRDLERPNSVGEKVIREFYHKYIEKLPHREKPSPLIQNEQSKRAIICDLDGTVAIHCNRGPFEYDKCDTDLPNLSVLEIIKNLSKDYHIVFMSGREDHCREKTIKWLTEQKIHPYQYTLIMRRSGDMRKDALIKRELFEELVKPNYYITAVFDDRNQVVEMWRNIGLTCLQVAPGDF